MQLSEVVGHKALRSSRAMFARQLNLDLTKDALAKGREGWRWGRYESPSSTSACLFWATGVFLYPSDPLPLGSV